MYVYIYIYIHIDIYTHVYIHMYIYNDSHAIFQICCVSGCFSALSIFWGLSKQSIYKSAISYGVATVSRID